MEPTKKVTIEDLESHYTEAQKQDFRARRVGAWVSEDGKELVSTMRCHVRQNAVRPFETAIQSCYFNGNQHVVVEAYDTLEAAEAGHQKWIEKIQAKPESLTMVLNVKMPVYERHPEPSLDVDAMLRRMLGGQE